MLPRINYSSSDSIPIPKSVKQIQNFVDSYESQTWTPKRVKNLHFNSQKKVMLIGTVNLMKCCDVTRCFSDTRICAAIKYRDQVDFEDQNQIDSLLNTIALRKIILHKCDQYLSSLNNTEQLD